jgi:hypothetical protein
MNKIAVGTDIWVMLIGPDGAPLPAKAKLVGKRGSWWEIECLQAKKKRWKQNGDRAGFSPSRDHLIREEIAREALQVYLNYEDLEKSSFFIERIIRISWLANT